MAIVKIALFENIVVVVLDDSLLKLVFIAFSSLKTSWFIVHGHTKVKRRATLNFIVGESDGAPIDFDELFVDIKTWFRLGVSVKDAGKACVFILWHTTSLINDIYFKLFSLFIVGGKNLDGLTLTILEGVFRQSDKNLR